MRRRLLVLVPALAAGFGLTACQEQSPTAVDRAPVQASVGDVVPGEWIVVFKNDVPDAPGLARQLVAGHGGQLRFTYQYALKGFAAALPDAAVIALRRNPQIAYIEPDRERHIEVQTIPTGVQRIFANTNAAIGIDGSDDNRVDVDVAIIDTGIDFQHPDLNVVGGVNCTGRIFFATCVAGGDDDHYHGTHVAGTVGALDNGTGVVGVAPGARLWAVKVLDKQGSGYSSWIIAGIDWVAAHASDIEVANMSLGGSGYSQSEYDAIQGAVNAGVAFAVAAGNSDADANNYSPGGFDNVLSVSALADFDGRPGSLGSPTCRTDQDETLADFSNWGPEIDVAAPGVCILSTYPIEQGSYGTISGTSMASPHAAGALALLASASNPNNASDVYSLYAQVKAAGNYNWTDDSGDGTKEPLLDVHLFAPVLLPTSGGGTDTPPMVNITNPTQGSTVSGSVTVSATATDDHGVTSVEFFVDGANIGSDSDGSNGWSTSWNTAGYTNGSHTVSARATDTAGQPGDVMSVAVTVSNAVLPALTLNSVTGRLVRNTKYSDLVWSGTYPGNVAVYRSGKLVSTTLNDGVYTDKPPKNTTTATYKVCHEGTSICSNEMTISAWN